MGYIQLNGMEAYIEADVFDRGFASVFISEVEVIEGI